MKRVEGWCNDGWMEVENYFYEFYEYAAVGSLKELHKS